MCNCRFQEHLGNFGSCPECHDLRFPKKTPHKHAALIKAWADGETIEYRQSGATYWRELAAGATPAWSTRVDYRIRPEPKPDIIMYGQENNPLTHARSSESVMPCVLTYIQTRFDQVKYTFDGETGKLKNVEIIK